MTDQQEISKEIRRLLVILNNIAAVDFDVVVNIMELMLKKIELLERDRDNFRIGGGH